MRTLYKFYQILTNILSLMVKSICSKYFYERHHSILKKKHLKPGSLLSITSVAEKPIAVNKATQDRIRPSNARIKIILDLLDKHLNSARLQFLEKESDRIIEHYPKIVYDKFPLYCAHCKHQRH
ncbi:hypothetical protein H5410_035438 [Solanum commersonii]|uniref:Uncharacterized protein n=1 Tax=Solanum commersonii TaxID=4109 RepID=A0A9J5Y555_SOLCO|nr:hypothetical protein H5410_035438 [Solanum commersonii]